MRDGVDHSLVNTRLRRLERRFLHIAHVILDLGAHLCCHPSAIGIVYLQVTRLTDERQITSVVVHSVVVNVMPNCSGTDAAWRFTYFWQLWIQLPGDPVTARPHRRWQGCVAHPPRMLTQFELPSLWAWLARQ
jgi:hypothetical protein